MNFDGISFGFVFSTFSSIIAGIALIYFSDAIADIFGHAFGTNVLRDLDKPYAYKFLGGFLILVSAVQLFFALFN